MDYQNAPPAGAALDFDDDDFAAVRTTVLLGVGEETGDDVAAPTEIEGPEAEPLASADPSEPMPAFEIDGVAYALPEGFAGAPIEDAAPTGRTTKDGISLAQILAERPDVYAGFFTAYFGPNNDHHSDAWMKRVGGETPEDYANYWYETYGRYGDYKPGGTAAGAPLEDGQEFGGRTTYNGVSIAQILHDRPDVYRAFFTEYYGPNNDHKSDAWVKRVGGETPEDYANYWYEKYGWYQYTPPARPSAPEPEPQPEDGVIAPPVEEGAEILPEPEVYELPPADDAGGAPIEAPTADPTDGWEV
ncbi:MAG: hypothetical protein DI570_07110 [Phenylobacterium zucineum]|nr:MAG: hypothetical protein DI570_07110 [Phenylobacterium zucineum]